MQRGDEDSEETGKTRQKACSGKVGGAQKARFQG
jgi:hypothetical protein